MIKLAFAWKFKAGLSTFFIPEKLILTASKKAFNLRKYNNFTENRKFSRELDINRGVRIEK